MDSKSLRSQDYFQTDDGKKHNCTDSSNKFHRRPKPKWKIKEKGKAKFMLEMEEELVEEKGVSQKQIKLRNLVLLNGYPECY